jgi:hypothetical protein
MITFQTYQAPAALYLCWKNKNPFTSSLAPKLLSELLQSLLFAPPIVITVINDDYWINEQIHNIH